MKQKVRRALAVSGMAIVIGTTGAAYEASANTLTDNANKTRTELRTRQFRQQHKTGAKKRTVPGFVTAVLENSLTMKRGNKTFAVNVSDTTRILNRKWVKINLGDIKTGDKLRVTGTLVDTTITAATVRDLSNPAHTSEKTTPTTTN